MARLVAPEGVTNYSHGGFSFDVGEDGTIEVEEFVAGPLRQHGFKDFEVAARPSEVVPVRREDLLVVLEMLGVSANPAMRADKLAAALPTAIAAFRAKKKPDEKKPDEKKQGAAS